MSEEEYQDIVLKWQFEWMAHKCGNRKCEDRYARIATPIDANMRYSLAKMILDAQSAEISRLKIHLGIAIDALKKFPNHANAGDALAMIGGGPMKPSGKGETT